MTIRLLETDLKTWSVPYYYYLLLNPQVCHRTIGNGLVPIIFWGHCDQGPSVEPSCPVLNLMGDWCGSFRHHVIEK